MVESLGLSFSVYSKVFVSRNCMVTMVYIH